MTAQVHEKIIYNGKESIMLFFPALPKNDLIVKEIKFDEIEDKDSIICSTACRRGYIGTWEIKDKQFYLVSIRGGRYKIMGDSPIFADWFNGVIRIPRSEPPQYVRMGISPVYREELHVEIEKGIVVKSKHLITDA